MAPTIILQVIKSATDISCEMINETIQIKHTIDIAARAGTRQGFQYFIGCKPTRSFRNRIAGVAKIMLVSIIPQMR